MAPDCKPTVYETDDRAPTGYQLIANAAYGDTGFSTSCGRAKVRELLRQQACKVGANAIKILKEANPNFWSTCYRVKAELIVL